MLKIKDNIDLKELKKYGFEYTTWFEPSAEKNADIGFCNSILDVMIVDNGEKVKDKKIKINEFNTTLSYEELDGLYDLIKDGLVEKVED